MSGEHFKFPQVC